MDQAYTASTDFDVSAAPVAATRVASFADRFAHSISLVVALTAHAMLLFAILPDRSEALGDEVTQLEAIAVSIVSSVPVAIGAQDATAAPAANEAIEEKQETAPEPDKAEPPPQQVAALHMAPEDKPPPPDAITLPETIPEPPPLPREPEVEKKPEERVEEKKPEPQPVMAASAPTPPPQAAAPASSGVLREYAKRVATTLAKSKPKGAGLVGTVKLRFVVDQSGRATDVAVVAASGTKALDEAAIRTLARSEFPPPPPELTVTQRTFEVPYQFR